MFEFYSTHPADKVELLVPALYRDYGQRLSANGPSKHFYLVILSCMGLLIMSARALCSHSESIHNLVFLSCLIFGLGTGLINAKAISI